MKENDCCIIEENTHGFYTYILQKKEISDITFFAHHKMFPFKDGGALIIHNKEMKKFNYNGENNPICGNPYVYNYVDIANQRKKNYFKLYNLIMEYSTDLLYPLRRIEELEQNVPQTFPIVIKRDIRDALYEYMNDNGFGVDSLYHTLIDPLHKPELEFSCSSRCRV